MTTTELETLTITDHPDLGELWLTCFGSEVPQNFDLTAAMKAMKDALILTGPYCSAASWNLLIEDARFVRRPGDSDGITTERLLIVMPYIAYGGPMPNRNLLAERRNSTMGLLNYYGFVYRTEPATDALPGEEDNTFKALADSLHELHGWGCEV